MRLCEDYYQCENCEESSPSSEISWVDTSGDSPTEVGFEEVGLFDDSDQMWCKKCREEEIWNEN